MITIKKQLEEVVQNLKVRMVCPNQHKILMPYVPKGFEIEFLGSDYKQIIDDVGNIYAPFIDMKVIVDFKVSYGQEVMWTKGLEVVVPGKYGTPLAINTKPYVIPEVQEWIGLEGEYLITKNSIIRISENVKEKLIVSAQILKQDLNEEIGLDLEIVIGGIVKEGDILLVLSNEDKIIGDEGYNLCINNFVKISACHTRGIFYGTRTLLQMLKRQKGKLEQGMIRDYPRYKKRGFMLDVGRRFSSMDALRTYVKLMAWYKMNDFHIHLNDNEIHIDEVNWEKAYSAFRLECDTYQGLTAKDGHYTKRAFGELIDFADKYGVDIVPEIDTPAHCLALTQYNKDLTLGIGKGRDHLNVMKEEAYEFIDKLWNEYLQGDMPVFRCKEVHIGADEYFGSDEVLEHFRAYTDYYLKWIKAKGKTPRLWGNLSSFKGQTPIISEGVTINIWSLDWVDAIEMIEAGYQIINSDDTRLYIVPHANYYRQYLDKENLFNTWEPNMFREEYTIPAGHPQLLGGAFSIWNDMINVPVSEEDIYDRAKEGIQVLAQKLWNNKFSGDYIIFDKICKEVHNCNL